MLEDRNLGVCGQVTNLRSPNQTAQAILDICLSPDRYLQMVRVGKIRVKTFYQQREVLKRYRRIFGITVHMLVAQEQLRLLSR